MGDNRQRLYAPADHVCGITDVGRVRDHNEDTFDVSDDNHILIVADGLGGHAAGEVASQLAVETITAWLTDKHEELTAGTEPIDSLLIGAVTAAHEKVFQASHSQPGCQGMATTLIVGYLHGDQLYTCHVGDVRCYMRTAAAFEPITQDHSLVGMLVQSGRLTADQARVHPAKNEVLQALGVPGNIAPEVNQRALSDGDYVLLCSDGLWEALSDSEIKTIVDRQGSMCERVTQLVDQANAAGGWDNITVVLYKHTAVKEQAAGR